MKKAKKVYPVYILLLLGSYNNNNKRRELNWQ